MNDSRNLFMKFEFFEKISRDEALVFLERFLTVESASIDELLEQASSEGASVDFSVTSVAALMRWAVAKLKTVPNAPDTQLPLWIRNTESYAKNLFEFDGPSKILTLRVAYYFGESFVRSYGGLRWTVGNLETAEAKMPVVAGFQSELEMAPILITENLLRRVTAGPTKLKDIDRAVDHWSQKV
jgi:hypothetical protein